MGQPTTTATGEEGQAGRGYDVTMYLRPIDTDEDADRSGPAEDAGSVATGYGFGYDANRLIDEDRITAEDWVTDEEWVTGEDASPPRDGPVSVEEEAHAADWLRQQLGALRLPSDRGADGATKHAEPIDLADLAEAAVTVESAEPADAADAVEQDDPTVPGDQPWDPDQQWTAGLAEPVDPYGDAPLGLEHYQAPAALPESGAMSESGAVSDGDRSAQEDTAALDVVQPPIAPGRSRTGVTVGILLLIAAMVIGGGVAFTYAVRSNDSGPGASAGPAPVGGPGAAVPGTEPDGAAGAPTDTGADNAGADASEEATAPTAAAPPPVAPRRRLSAPIAGRSQARFDLVTGATTVTLRGGDLGGDLYRISVPDGSGILPKVVNTGGQIQLHLVPSGVVGPSSVQILLSTKARWQLRLTGGAAEHNIDLAALRLTGDVEVAGGATRLDLTLPRPNGTDTVRLSGGAKQVTVHVPRRIPVRVRIGSGAAAVTIDGHTRSGVAPGATFESNGFFHAANDRYVLDVPTGVGTLTVDRR